MTESLREPGSSDSGLRDELVPAGLIKFSLRVWSLPSEDITWSSRHAVIGLIADLLVACRGDLVPESRGALLARFDRPEAAVVAARRLQKVLQVFTTGLETAAFGVSIIIHTSEDQGQVGTASSIWEFLGSQAVPGQIVVSDKMHDALQFTPEVQFRTVSGKSSPSYTFREFFWAEAEELTAWQKLLIDANYRSSQKESLRLVLQTGNEAPDAVVEPVDGLAARPEKHLAFLPHHLPRQMEICLAVSAACLALIATVGLLRHSATVHFRKQKSSPEVLKIDSLPLPPTNSSTFSSDTGKQKVPVIIETPRPTLTPVPRVQRKPATKIEAPVAEYEGFTNKDVPQLVRRADEDSGAGNYEDAKREYEIVLKLQPGNPSAQNGLRKVNMKTGGKR